MSYRIQFRKGTAAGWTASGTILGQGEVGIVTDAADGEPNAKLGDGTTAWDGLGWWSPGGGGAGGAVQVLTSSGSVALTSAETTIELNGPDITVSLPDAADATARTVTVKLTYPFTTGTISAHGSQVIDGYPSYPLTAQYQWATLQSDGTGWMITSAKPGGPLAIFVTTLPDGTTGEPYSAQLAAIGGWPGYTWSVKSGSLPDGLSLSPSGALTGTPGLAATSGFTVQVTDSVGAATTASLSITIAGGIIFVQRGALFNDPYVASPVFLNPTTAGNLLLAYIGCNGSAAPTTGAAGWVIKSNAGGTSCIAYKENCAAGETAPVFTGVSTTDIWAYLEEWSGAVLSGAFDQDDSSTDEAQQWTATFTSFSGTPGELVAATGYWNGSNLGGTVAVESFTDNTGDTMPATLIQGATAYGQYFAGMYGLTGETGSDYITSSMEVSVYAGGDGIMASFKAAAQGAPGDPVIATASLPDGSTNLPYGTVHLAAEGGVPPYVWSLSSGSMPAGLTLSSGGVITGTPTAAASNSLHLKVTDSASNTGTATLGLDVASTPTPTFTTTAPQGESAPYSPPFLNGTIAGVTQGVPVNNNVWNPVTGWSSALSVVDPTEWWLVANFPAGNTAVSAYPSLGAFFTELPLGGFTKITSSFSEKMNANPGSQCWAAYDIWLDNWAWEIMIHHDLALFNPWDNTALAAGISFGGSNGVPVVSWDLHFYGTSEFVWRPSAGFPNVQSSSVDILGMLQWMITNGYLPAVNTLTAIGYGWEICSTGGVDEFFELSAFSLDAEYG